MREKLVVCFRDEDGNERQASGDSLEELSQHLAEMGYTGGSIRVCDEPGFTVGWVSAGYWKAA